MQAEHDAKEAEPVKPIYTQAMKDAGELPSAGMACLFKKKSQEDIYYHTCFIVGSSKFEDWLIFQASDMNIHSHNINNGEFSFKPIDTRTPKEKQVDEISALLSKSCLTTHVECVKLLQQKGLLAEIK
jgi:hypothetical protein